jgi:hypothetical protein
MLNIYMPRISETRLRAEFDEDSLLTHWQQILTHDIILHWIRFVPTGAYAADYKNREGIEEDKLPLSLTQAPQNAASAQNNVLDFNQTDPG